MRAIVSIICLTPLVLAALCFTTAGKTNPPEGKVRLVFHHYIGNEELVLGNPVKNSMGETITVEKFKYYLSNFSVTDEKGIVTKLPVNYFLVDESDASSKTITLTIPAITVTHISFLLGVDSIRNVSGIQTGVLDPLKGMFWTWNSGYIMAKLEGSSESAKTPGNHFTYDIGGFRKGMNTAKWIGLIIDDRGKAVEKIDVNADINHWFKGSTEIKISETPFCHSPGSLAMKIADNYCTMFSINSAR